MTDFICEDPQSGTTIDMFRFVSSPAPPPLSPNAPSLNELPQVPVPAAAPTSTTLAAPHQSHPVTRNLSEEDATSPVLTSTSGIASPSSHMINPPFRGVGPGVNKALPDLKDSRSMDFNVSTASARVSDTITTRVRDYYRTVSSRFGDASPSSTSLAGAAGTLIGIKSTNWVLVAGICLSLMSWGLVCALTVSVSQGVLAIGCVTIFVAWTYLQHTVCRTWSCSSGACSPLTLIVVFGWSIGSHVCFGGFSGGQMTLIWTLVIPVMARLGCRAPSSLFWLGLMNVVAFVALAAVEIYTQYPAYLPQSTHHLSPLLPMINLIGSSAVLLLAIKIGGDSSVVINDSNDQTSEELNTLKTLISECLICTARPDGTVVFSTDAFDRLFGREMKGVNVWQYVEEWRDYDGGRLSLDQIETPTSTSATRMKRSMEQRHSCTSTTGGLALPAFHPNERLSERTSDGSALTPRTSERMPIMARVGIGGSEVANPLATTASEVSMVTPRAERCPMIPKPLLAVENPLLPTNLSLPDDSISPHHIAGMSPFAAHAVSRPPFPRHTDAPRARIRTTTPMTTASSASTTGDHSEEHVGTNHAKTSWERSATISLLGEKPITVNFEATASVVETGSSSSGGTPRHVAARRIFNLPSVPASAVPLYLILNGSIPTPGPSRAVIELSQSHTNVNTGLSSVSAINVSRYATALQDLDLLKRLVDSLLMVEWNREGLITRASRTFTQVFANGAAILGRPRMELVHHGDVGRVSRSVDSSIPNVPFKLSYRCGGKSNPGSTTAIPLIRVFSAACFLSSSGGFIEIVSEYKPDDDEAMIQSTLQTSLLQSISEGVLFLSDDMRIRLTNRATSVMFGYDFPEELMGQHISKIVSGVDVVSNFQLHVIGSEWQMLGRRKNGSLWTFTICRHEVVGELGESYRLYFVSVPKPEESISGATTTYSPEVHHSVSGMSKSQLMEIIDHFQECFMLLDADSIILEANSAACHLLGYTPEDIKGTPVGALFSGDPFASPNLVTTASSVTASPRSKSSLTSFISAHIPHKCPSLGPTMTHETSGCVALGKCGIRVPVSTSSASFTFETTRFSCIIFTDLRPQLEQQRILQEAMNERESSAFVLHEVRNPLNSIVLGVDYLLETVRSEGPLPESAVATVREELTSIHHTCLHITQLLGNVLEVSKALSGTLQLEHTVFNIRTECDDAHNAVRHLINQNVHFVNYVVDCAVFGSPRHLKQVLINLLANAAKFTRSGSIALNVLLLDQPDENSSRFQFQVCDTGPGIPPNLQHQLFAKYCQLGTHAGTGLGLFLSQQLVRLMGGEIQVQSPWRRRKQSSESTDLSPRDFVGLAPPEGSSSNSPPCSSEGRREGRSSAGTTQHKPDSSSQASELSEDMVIGTMFYFSLTLQIRGAQAIFRRASQLSAGLPLSLRVLIVDDDTVTRALLQRVFTSMGDFRGLGWKVETANDGAEALDIVRARKVDVITMDHRLAGEMSGIDTTRAIRRMEAEKGFSVSSASSSSSSWTPQQRKEALILGMSGDCTEAFIKECLDAGMDHCFAKPLPPHRRLAADIAKLWWSKHPQLPVDAKI